MEVMLPPKGRDLRLDLFRGLANWVIFIAHIPNNVVAYFMLERGVSHAHVVPGAPWQGSGEAPGSVPPEVLEARRAQLRVPGGVSDRDMPKPILNCPGIDAVIGELIAAAVPQHVEMHEHR
jgi:OpgC protein